MVLVSCKIKMLELWLQVYQASGAIPCSKCSLVMTMSSTFLGKFSHLIGATSVLLEINHGMMKQLDCFVEELECLLSVKLKLGIAMPSCQVEE